MVRGGPRVREWVTAVASTEFDTPEGAGRASLSADPATDDAGRLILRCAAGERAALHTLYTAMAPMLLGLAARMLGDRRLGEEAVQDCFVQVWRNAAQFDPALGGGRSWMIGILRFRAIDLRESERRRAPINPVEMEAADQAGALGATPPPPMDDRMALRHCLGQLKDAARHSIMMAYVEGCSHAEIAERLDQPLGTVKSWILRGLASLRECLER